MYITGRVKEKGKTVGYLMKDSSTGKEHVLKVDDALKLASRIKNAHVSGCFYTKNKGCSDIKDIDLREIQKIKGTGQLNKDKDMLNFWESEKKKAEKRVQQSTKKADITDKRHEMYNLLEGKDTEKMEEYVLKKVPEFTSMINTRVKGMGDVNKSLKDSSEITCYVDRRFWTMIELIVKIAELKKETVSRCAESIFKKAGVKYSGGRFYKLLLKTAIMYDGLEANCGRTREFPVSS